MIKPSSVAADRIKLYISSCKLEPDTAGSANEGNPVPLVDFGDIPEMVTKMAQIIELSVHRQTQESLPSSPMRSQDGDISDDSMMMATQFMAGKRSMPSSEPSRHGSVEKLEQSGHTIKVRKLISSEHPRKENSMDHLLSLLSGTDSVKRSKIPQDQLSLPVDPAPEENHRLRAQKIAQAAQEVADEVLMASQYEIKNDSDTQQSSSHDKNTIEPPLDEGGAHPSSDDGATDHQQQSAANYNDHLWSSGQLAEFASQPSTSDHKAGEEPTDFHASNDQDFHNLLWSDLKRIPRGYVIPKDQRAILDSDAAWFAHKDSKQMTLANIPAKTLKELQSFYINKSSKRTVTNSSAPHKSFEFKDAESVNLHTSNTDGDVGEEQLELANLEDDIAIVDGPDISLVPLQPNEVKESIQTPRTGSQNVAEDIDNALEWSLSPDGHFCSSEAGINDAIHQQSQKRSALTKFRPLSSPIAHPESEAPEDDNSITPHSSDSADSDDSDDSDYHSGNESAQPATLHSQIYNGLRTDADDQFRSSMSEDELEIAAPYSLVDSEGLKSSNQILVSQVEPQPSLTKPNSITMLQVQKTPINASYQSKALSIPEKSDVPTTEDNYSSDPIIPGILEDGQMSDYEDQAAENLHNIEVSASYTSEISAVIRDTDVVMSSPVQSRTPMILEESDDDEGTLSQYPSRHHDFPLESNHSQDQSEEVEVIVAHPSMEDVSVCYIDELNPLRPGTDASQSSSSHITTMGQSKPTRGSHERQDDSVGSWRHGAQKRSRELSSSPGDKSHKKSRQEQTQEAISNLSNTSQEDISALAILNRRKFLMQIASAKNIANERIDASNAGSGAAANDSTESSKSKASFSKASVTPSLSHGQAELNIVEIFREAYAEYRGSSRTIIKVCVYIDWLRTQGRAPHPSLWDDFIRAFASDYLPFVTECHATGNIVPPHLEFYNDRVLRPRFDLMIITPATINEVFLAYPADTAEFTAPFAEHPAITSQAALSEPTSQQKTTGSKVAEVAESSDVPQLQEVDETTLIPPKSPKSVSASPQLQAAATFRRPFFTTESQLPQTAREVMEVDVDNPKTSFVSDTEEEPEVQILETIPLQKPVEALPWSTPNHKESATVVRHNMPSSPILGESSPVKISYPTSSHKKSSTPTVNSVGRITATSQMLNHNTTTSSRPSPNKTYTPLQPPQRHSQSQARAVAPSRTNAASPTPSNAAQRNRPTSTPVSIEKYVELMKSGKFVSRRRRSRLSGISVLDSPAPSASVSAAASPQPERSRNIADGSVETGKDVNTGNKPSGTMNTAMMTAAAAAALNLVGWH